MPQTTQNNCISSTSPATFVPCPKAETPSGSTDGVTFGPYQPGSYTIQPATPGSYTIQPATPGPFEQGFKVGADGVSFMLGILTIPLLLGLVVTAVTYTIPRAFFQKPTRRK